jgi:hypothetical protein
MRWKGWDRIPLTIPDPADPLKKKQVSAIAPLIISASRSTDIPAFYGDWFLSRLAAGYAKWRNPFGGEPVYVSFAQARVFAFWSKNPEPFLSCLDELDRTGYGFFFLFTLNDYENEGLEPGLPPLDERIATFIRLAQRTGPGRIVWRFDPLLLSDTISVDDLLDRIQGIGNRLCPFTRRLVVSFIDIARYGKVQRNLAAAGCSGVREFTDDEVTALAEGLFALNSRWGLSITACGERRDLTAYGIGRGQCIGYELLASEFSHDPVLGGFLSVPDQVACTGTGAHKYPSRQLKDPGQRSTCGCIVSKDIGQYSTCPHACLYCYANASPALARRNYQQYLTNRRQEIFHDCIVL